MLAFAEMGGIVFPPVPAFYQKPTTVDEIVDHTVGRVLERMGLGDCRSPGVDRRRPQPPS